MSTHTKVALLLFAFIIISCDKDYNTLGSDIVGNAHFDFELDDQTSIAAYTKATNAVQSNNLSINTLGVYNNPVFGTTKAHIVSQLELVTAAPDIGYSPFIDSVKDSVYVYIPYYNTINSTDANGTNTYALNSVYGNTTNGKIDIKVYQNGYLLNSFNPDDNFISAQKYYTDDKSKITTNIVKDAPAVSTGLLNDPTQSTQFTIDTSEIVIYKTDGDGGFLNSAGASASSPDEYVVKKRKAPGIWINLDKSVFKKRILDGAANGKLFNNSVFKEYFKGLYFEVDKLTTDEGFLAKLDLTKAEVVMQYQTYDTQPIDTPDPLTSVKRSINFRMGYGVGNSANKANTINLIETTQVKNYADALAGINTKDTQGRLFLKGGANGTIAFIDLFDTIDISGGTNGGTNEIPDKLDELRGKGWLINEANLVFYVDQDQMTASSLVEPNRIYLYDATNSAAINDYLLDSSVDTDAQKAKYIYSGIGERDGNGKMLKYKFRITEHIKKLIKTTDTSVNLNLRLGLVICEDINKPGFLNLKTAIDIGTDKVTKVPVTSVMNPFGIILHGPQSSALGKKLKLEIYYTKPN